MHHIAAHEIPMEKRRPRLIAYASQMRSALLDPTLPPRIRRRLEARLARIKAEIGALSR